jgi:hypothetical protein
MGIKAKQINPDNLRAHMALRKAQLEELDSDLQHIFDGIPIESIFEPDLIAALDLQRIRSLKYLSRSRRL